MEPEFSIAKDGSQTFSAEGVFFHSTYSPKKEAQRFADSINSQNEPSVIFLIEPGLAYSYDYLKAKFPLSLIVCIRLFSFQLEDENKWDYLLRYNDIPNLPLHLITVFGEEKILCSTMCLWKPAENLFSKKISSIFAEYKKALEDSKTVIVTRQFFEKKWLLNSINFFNNLKFCHHQKIHTDLPVAVCASGPSLSICLSVLKEKQRGLFIICLSSATSVLLKNNIIPDLVLTTDGGFWAGQHLKGLNKFTDIPIACPCEAFIPKFLLRKNPFFILNYSDESSFISSEIIQKSGTPSFTALRNPTVSGTALYFAKSITNKNIYFCGLDLKSAKGFQHTQPNELEKNNCLNDNRIKPGFSRLTSSEFNSDSLKIYRNWFASQKNVDNVYRIINAQNNPEPLGQIKDISAKEFEAGISLNKPKEIHKIETKKIEINSKNIIDFVIEKLSSEKWQKQIFPADFISLKNCNDEEQKKLLQKRLEDKKAKLIEKLRRLQNV